MTFNERMEREKKRKEWDEGEGRRGNEIRIGGEKQKQTDKEMEKIRKKKRKRGGEEKMGEGGTARGLMAADGRVLTLLVVPDETEAVEEVEDLQE